MVNRMNSSFPNRSTFTYLKFTKYVTNIIDEPKNKYGQQEQATARNHNWVDHRMVVRLDIRHWLHRWDAVVIKQTHAKYPAFVSAMAGAVLAYKGKIGMVYII